MSKDIVILLAASFLTVTGWVAFEAIHTSRQPTLDQEIVLQIEPIDPELDLEVLEILKNKGAYE